MLVVIIVISCITVINSITIGDVTAAFSRGRGARPAGTSSAIFIVFFFFSLFKKKQLEKKFGRLAEAFG
jgi:uncharacterized membrane protein